MTHEGRRIVLTACALLALASASWLLAHVALGALAAPVAMLVAAIKAALVATVFMRLSHGTVLARSALAIALAFTVLLTLIVSLDVWMR